MPTRGPAAQSEADLFKQRPEPTCPVSVAFSQDRDLFDEGFTRTVWLMAAKAANPQVDHPLPARDRQIREVALIAAVERFRPSAAFRAACAYRFAADGNMDNFVPQLHSLD